MDKPHLSQKKKLYKAIGFKHTIKKMQQAKSNPEIKANFKRVLSFYGGFVSAAGSKFVGISTPADLMPVFSTLNVA